MKNLLTQQELRTKTDPKLEFWQFFANLTIKPVFWLILMTYFCHLANALTNTNDKGENLAIYCQVCIYGSDSPLLISYLGLKGV